MLFTGFQKKEEIEIFHNDRDEFLEEIFDSIQRISKIDGRTVALHEVEKLINLIIENYTRFVKYQNKEISKNYKYELEEAKQEIEILRNDIKEIELQIKEKRIIKYKIENINNHLDDLSIYWQKKIQEQLNNEVCKIKDDGYAIIKNALIEFHKNNIENSLTNLIKSISSVLRIIDTLNEAEEFLIKNNMINEELQNKIRKGRERCAWTRVRKKLDDADIAEAVQNIKKKEKLRAEAKVLIKQDWALVFPNEEPPKLD